jgi:hypothetical protein
MNGIRASVLTTALLPFVLALNASGQQNSSQSSPAKDPSFERGRAALRVIARALGACPATVTGETKWGKEPWDVSQMMDGAPTNVAWDVAPSQTARSPYAGYIEFSAYHSFSVQPENRDRFERKHPKLYSDALMQFKNYKIRYEFDLGAEGVELARTLYRARDETQWKDGQSSNPCWQNALRAVAPEGEAHGASPASAGVSPQTSATLPGGADTPKHRNSVVHDFGFWGNLNDRDKNLFFTGFTNGLFHGANLDNDALISLGKCIEGVDQGQLIAMIDKYYRENPEKWSASVGDQIVLAISVKGGPCEGLRLERLTH